MKEIKAYIRPPMADTVVDALEAMPGIPGVAVTSSTGLVTSSMTASRRVSR